MLYGARAQGMLPDADEGCICATAASQTLEKGHSLFFRVRLASELRGLDSSD